MGDSFFIDKFNRIGLTKKKSEETAKNKKLSTLLDSIIDKVERNILGGQVDVTRGVLLYQVASQKFTEEQLDIVIQMVCERKITSGSQISCASEYFKKCSLSNFNLEDFEKECGVGVTYDDSEIEAEVISALSNLNFASKNSNIIPRGPVIGAVTKKYKWINIQKLNEIIDKKILECPQLFNKKANLFPQTTNGKAKSCPQKGLTDWKSLQDAIDPKTIYKSGEASKFHIPGQNHLSPNYIVTPNTARLMSEHIKKYGEQVRTRFPPEPNGILHIGHAKAINFSFGYAKAFDGITFLRYDDTNPVREEERFFKGIHDVIIWLGFTPHDVTHTSDYFDYLYDCALQMIEKDLAYVCHQSPETVRGYNCPPSPWRDRPKHESLRLFKEMRDGKFGEGEATLRLKYVMEDGKTDPVAYRILFSPHHRTGLKWCIYPTYAFSHPLCDSKEGITHSFCTKEFQNQRSFYYWLCNSLDIYCPVQWEFGRLNLGYSVISKRKILKLIENNIVDDWDDPRLFTLASLRRRGVPPEAINYFCSKVGVTMASSTINNDLFYSCIREVLNIKAKRVMAALDPLLIKISNLHAPFKVEAPLFPYDPSLGSRYLEFGSEIFIDSADFLESSSDKDFRRLTPTQHVGLLYTNKAIRLTNIIRNEKNISHLICELVDLDSIDKPRAFIQWVHHGLPCSIKLYEELFIHSNPDDAEGGFLNDINPNSLFRLNHCLVEKTVSQSLPLTSFQFERLGYFCLDVDSQENNLIFNRTIALK